MSKDQQAASNVISIVTSIQELISRLTTGHGQPPATYHSAVDRAWSILLDLDTRLEGLPDEVDRPKSNLAAISQACSDLSQQHRTADAASLQRRAQQWLRASHYVSRQGHAAGPAHQSSSTGSETSSHALSAVPLSENEAVLSLLLGLQGTCPPGHPSLASLPALGSSLLRSLQEEGQAAAAVAATATAHAGSTGQARWVPMSAQPEELLLQEQRNRTCSEMQKRPAEPCSSNANSSSTRAAPQQQWANAAADAGPWVSPAAAAMQLLQQVPLDAAASASTLAPTGQQHDGSEPPDDILIAAACAPGDSAVTVPTAPPQDAAMPAPLLQTLGQQMQLASSAGCLGRPLGLSSSLGSTSRLGNDPGKAAGASQKAAVGVGSMGPAAIRTSTSPCYSGAAGRNDAAGLAAGVRAAVQQDAGVSAAAAEAAAAARAAAAVRPAVASLMKLSSAEPGSGSSRLSQPEAVRDSSNTETAIGEGSVKQFKAAPQQQSDIKTTRDVSRATSYQQQPLILAASGPSGTSSSSSIPPQELESELVSTACLALQGVWTAVQQLWELVLQSSLRERSNLNAGRVPGQGLSAVQCRLLVQVLHTAELRLRLQAFLHQFQPSHNSDWTTSTHRPGDSSSSSDVQGQQELCAMPVQVAFMNAVQVVLAEHDASLATAQQHKLQGARQQQPSTLLQLLTVHRGMLRQLQQLAELCWCTVQEFLDKNMFLKTTSSDEPSNKKKPSPPPGTSSSSALSWHILQQARRDKQDVVAAAAALQGAALVAYEQALPWPGQLEGAAAVHMWWAPSTWQLKHGFLGGHALLEQLYEGVLQAGPEATPLLSHLFAAAVQPVLLSLRSWAFMPDTVAAEAAAEATAMSSFTAGVQQADSRALLLAAAPCAEGSAQHLAPPAAGALTVASTGYGLFAQAAAAGTPAAAVGACSSGNSRPWSGSKGAEAAMRHCLQQAWHSIRGRAPACPGFLAHIQQPAGVAGMQLHLLQLLGGPGQRLADRLGWLTELEQQEVQEVLTGCAGAPGNASGASLSGDPAAAGFSRFGAFMGLLCSSSVSVGAGEQAAGASSPLCSLSSQQLEQCAAIAADYDAARQVELQSLLQDLSAHRAAGQAAHVLWLACRQEERHEAEQARIRLESEAAARRKQRQQQLLTQQQEQIALVEARRLGAHLDQLAMERQLLQQSALQEHQQALQQLQDELARLHGGGSQPPAADSTTVRATGATGSTAAAENTAQPPKASRCLISSFAAAAAEAAAVLDDMVDPSSIVLSVPGATDPHATAAGDMPSMEGVGDEHTTLAAPTQAGDAATQSEVQQQQRRERGTWGQPLRSIAPAAGVPSGQGASGPLAVIGSALTHPEPVQAAGRRSNSQPKVLPGMGRPVSLSRRNSSSDDAGMDSGIAAAAASGSSGAAAAGAGSTSLGAGRASRSSGMGGVGSILGGFGALAVVGAGPGKAHQGLQAKGKWGVPIVPVPAAGLASNLQRRASTGALQGLDGISSNSGSETPICSSGTDMGQVQHKSQLQRRPSGGLGYSSGAMADGSRPGTPQRARRLSEHLTGAESSMSARQQQQQHLQWQHSWHHMQQQQQQMLLLQSPAPGEPCSVAGGGVQAVAQGTPAGAAASTGWLMSRHQVRPENQGNRMLLDWVVQQSGVSTADDAGDAAAAGSTYSDAAEGKQLRSGQSRKAGSGCEAGPSNKPGLPRQVGTQAAAAAPLIATLEVLVVQPLLAQQRLTTHACWNLLLHEHRLLQRMNAIQGLFFQQQGDWVALLCEGLQPLLQQHQHQQQKEQGSGAANGSGAVEGAAAARAASLSPVVLQLLLESSVQQSCLVGLPEAEKMSLQVEAGRALPGWGTTWSPSRRGRKEQQAAAAAVAAAAATDCLRLSYDVPWPLSLLLGESQLQQYGDIFSVLLRLRQLQQQLMKQWQPLNSRASSGGSSSRSNRRRGMQRHTSEYGAPYHRKSSSGVEVDKRRYTWHGAPQQQLGACDEEAAAAEEECAAAAAAVSEGLSRLQDLRLWHAVALHCIDSLLGYMLGELSGQLQVRFEAAVGSQPVSLPVMLEAHAGLLAAARTVCLLPPAEHQQHDGDQQRVTAGSLAGAVYALVNTAWQLQQHITELLAMRDAAGTAAAGVAGMSSSCGPVLAKAASGFKEGQSCTAIALRLAGEADELWEAVQAAGLHMEGLLADLKRRLKSSVAAAVGHPLAGLAARLGVQC